ncbi:MAG: hypothetical protein ABIQ01_07220 [Pseudolysinimonas sp.]
MNPLVRHAVLGVVLTSVVLGTAACGLPPAPHATPDSPVVAATPEPADPAGPAAASGERPEPAADVTCNDLTNPAQLDPIFAVAVNLAPPTRTYEYVGATIADEWVVRQAGGIACQWSDPEGISTSEGRYLSGMDLRLLAASGPQWQEYSDAEGDGSDQRFSCSEYGYCDFDVYTATGWWLSLSAFNIDALPAPTEASLRALTLPVFSSIATTVAALPAPDPGWAAPTPDIAFGGGCTGVTTGERIASALGLGVAVGNESYEYPYITTAAMLSIGGSDCRWVRASDGWDIAYIEVLPGGSWAQEAAKAAMEANGATVPTPAVAGVPAGATALYHHVDSTALDVVLGGSWIKISISAGSETGVLSVEDALVAIGADIAAHAG